MGQPRFSIRSSVKIFDTGTEPGFGLVKTQE
jgi:hypothetical protein